MELLPVPSNPRIIGMKCVQLMKLELGASWARKCENPVVATKSNCANTTEPELGASIDFQILFNSCSTLGLGILSY